MPKSCTADGCKNHLQLALALIAAYLWKNWCTLAEALFPIIQCGERTDDADDEWVWMRDAVYIVLISALMVISCIINIKIYYLGINSV